MPECVVCLFAYMYGCLVSMDVHTMVCLVSGRGQKRAAESLELELELTVSGNMGVGNSTWDLLEDLSGALNH